jgi:LmbE family N-acetylglucosaminyl deacetylase
MQDTGITPSFARMEVDSLGSPNHVMTTVLNVGKYVDTKTTSLNCHRTQMDPNDHLAKLQPDIMHKFMNTEYFTLALPKGTGESVDILANFLDNLPQ